jgi:hypothetical protein
MTRFAERVQVAVAATAVAGAVAVALVGGSGSRPAAAQDKDSPYAREAPDPGCEYLGKGPTKATAGELSLGVGSCRACHLGADQGQAEGYVKTHKSNEFVLLNESVTWDKQDVHSKALATLNGKLGRDMQELLKKDNPSYKVTEDVRCLTCHSADKSPAKPLAQKVLTDFATGVGGVNCTVCHGMHEKWQIDHTKEPDNAGEPMPWREKSPAYKWERGMADLRNPVVKALLCASCHVGNPAEGKIVTHEMYAAGHPPLPPFELASYMQYEPKHWGYPTEMKYFQGLTEDKQMAEKDGDGRQQFWTPAARWKTFHFHHEKEESYLARHFAVGAVAALRAEAQLVRHEAQLAQKSGEDTDFARFECYSCHRVLKYPSDRQAAGYDGLPPGRPRARASAGVPVRLVAEHAAGVTTGGLGGAAKDFGPKYDALRASMTVRNFGKPADMVRTAGDVIAWCDGFLKVQSESDKPLYPEAEAKRLRAMIAKEAEGGKSVVDPDVALGLTWAHLTLGREAKVNFPQDAVKALRTVVPENVRDEPPTADRAQYDRRMKLVEVFNPGAFRKAFTGVNALN